jgi:hypothetical protein
MPKIAYVEHKFGGAARGLIARCNAIIEEYLAQGFQLTLRQLYYQLVSREVIPNTLRFYKNLGSLVNDARLAGLIDWDSIEDRTRNLESLPHWDTPSEIVESCSRQFRVDLWDGQEYRPEVWIEKDALAGVIAGVCNELDVPFFSCRGYTSQSEMWAGAMRLMNWSRDHQQTPIIFHLGDHDPSGKDMTRDIQDRLELFMGGTKLERLALNMDQVRRYKPPPNPAKITDSRAAGYIAEFGKNSWELDALEPRVIATLIRNAIQPLIDKEKWKEREAEIEHERKVLAAIAERWDEVEQLVEE